MTPHQGISMKMTDMKMAAGERKKMMPTTVETSKGPSYPWGLVISLDAASMDKMGIKEMPEVGVECEIHGVGKVTRVSESASPGRKDRSMEIQITKLAVAHEDDEESFRRGFAKGPKRGRY